MAAGRRTGVAHHRSRLRVAAAAAARCSDATKGLEEFSQLLCPSCNIATATIESLRRGGNNWVVGAVLRKPLTFITKYMMLID
jgi:hypothetical protein